MTDVNKNTKPTKPTGGIKREPGDVVTVDNVQKNTKDTTSETVTMTKEQYDALLKTMSDLSAKVDAVSDKNRLDLFKERNKDGSILPIAGISMVDSKYVIGWRTISNEAEFRDGKYREQQITELMFRDGTVQKMDYIDFIRNKVKVSCEIISKKEVDGEKFYTIKLPEGEELELSIKFLN